MCPSIRLLRAMSFGQCSAAMPFQDEPRCYSSRQQHGVRVGSRRVDATRRSRFAHSAYHRSSGSSSATTVPAVASGFPFEASRSSGTDAKRALKTLYGFSSVLMKTVVVPPRLAGAVRRKREPCLEGISLKCVRVPRSLITSSRAVLSRRTGWWTTGWRSALTLAKRSQLSVREGGSSEFGIPRAAICSKIERAVRQSIVRGTPPR